MSPQQIIDKARAAVPNADIEDDGGTVRFVQKFSVFEGQEAHDVADDTAFDIYEALREVDLCVDGRESDNDSVWGVIEEAPA